MRGNPIPRGWLALGVLLCALLAWPHAARADDDPKGATETRATVPDVRRRRLEDAMRVLEAAGLKVGTIYEFGLDRIERMFRVRGVVGTVFLQKPTPGTGWPTSKPIDIVLVAEKDGKLPPELTGARKPEPKAPKEAPAKKEPAKDPVVPPNGEPRDDPVPPVPPGTDAPPVPRTDAPPSAEGSPDAPRKAAKPDPSMVPELVGLDLAEAEMLVRDSQMRLHVERVPGHPVGKVLEQKPGGGTKRPQGGMIKVVITAGGDFESRTPGPPAVYVESMAIPSLLDRTKAQAERIVVALGLEVDFREAKSGLAGRVVDQKPGAGEKVARGGLVTLWIGPGAKDDADCEVPPPLGPLGAGDKPTAAKGDGAKSDAAKADAEKAKKDATPKSDKPLAPGPLPGGAPRLVSPAAGTKIPAGAKVPVGFTWQGIKSANAYILEVEEMGAEGRWLPLARKPSRTTAVLMDVERLDPKGESKLRWRVTAVMSGRRGPASKWVVLK